ncbi:SDR family oxidoreductase [Bacillus tianshenii]|nr:SDR family oxidoreductase [Bacillus tianshenii]
MTEKWALITGASGGIGSEAARKLASMGFHLYLHYNQDAESVQKLKDELPVPVEIIQADFSAQYGVEECVRRISRPLHTIVHNSGKSVYGMINDMRHEDVQEMLQLHCSSPYLLTKELLPQMISQRCGRIVFVTSIWGEAGASCETLYSMVKGGQNALVKALAKEVAPSGITVNAVSPGAVATKMMDGFNEEELQMICDEIPAGRLAKAEEIAQLIGFLCSEEASYIQGQVIGVNGGWHT